MPLEVCPFPIELPGIAAANIGDLRDGLFNPVIGVIEGRAVEKQFDRLSGNTLPFANLIAEILRGSAV